MSIIFPTHKQAKKPKKQWDSFHIMWSVLKGRHGGCMDVTMNMQWMQTKQRVNWVGNQTSKKVKNFIVLKMSPSTLKCHNELLFSIHYFGWKDKEIRAKRLQELVISDLFTPYPNGVWATDWIYNAKPYRLCRKGGGIYPSSNNFDCVQWPETSGIISEDVGYPLLGLVSAPSDVVILQVI